MTPLSKEARVVLTQQPQACEAGDGSVLSARFRADTVSNQCFTVVSTSF